MTIPRQICTPEQPYSVEIDQKQGWIHPQAHEFGEQRDGWPGGDIVTYRCPVCNHVWEQELPQ